MGDVDYSACCKTVGWERSFATFIHQHSGLDDDALARVLIADVLNGHKEEAKLAFSRWHSVMPNLLTRDLPCKVLATVLCRRQFQVMPDRESLQEWFQGEFPELVPWVEEALIAILCEDVEANRGIVVERCDDLIRSSVGPLHTVEELPAGTRLGPQGHDGQPQYVIVNEVGRGATGAVYKAVDSFSSASSTGEQHYVAIKIFHDAVANHVGNEMSRLKEIDSPHVVRALHGGDEDVAGKRRSYIAFAFEPGGALYNREVPLDPKKAVTLVSRL